MAVGRFAAIGALALLTWLAPATASAAGFAGIMALPAPQVTNLSPILVHTGEQVVLHLQGHSLRNGLGANFGAGIQVQPTSRAGGNGQNAYLQIRIAPDARLGRRQLTLIVDGKRTAQNAYISVERAALHGFVPPHTIFHPKTETGAPSGMVPPVSILAQVRPQSVRAGSRVQVILEGRNLMRGLRIDYGMGVHVESLQVLSDTRATAVLRIDQSAPAGQRMPHATEPDARLQVLPQAGLRVISAFTPAPGGAPRISHGGFAPSTPAMGQNPSLLSIEPNRLEAGQRYQVTAYGQHLDSRLELNLGNGIHIDRMTVLDDRRAQLSLHVDAETQAGTRRVQARAGSERQWATQPATILIARPFRIVRLPKPKLPVFDWKHTIEGRILLEAPKWFSGKMSVPHQDPLTHKVYGQDVVPTGIHVPTVKDDNVFTWREQNPDLAEWFEVRFYAGNTLIAKQRVDKLAVSGRSGKVLPTWLIPPPKLIATLAQAAAARRVTVTRDSKTGKFKVSGKIGASPAPGAHKGGMPASDLTWEVVGYRRYLKSGVERRAAWRARAPVRVAALGSAQQVAVTGGFAPPSSSNSPGTMLPHEVERSERWPLNMPYGPTGLSCGNEAPSGLDVKLIDNSAASGHQPFSTKVATTAHTGERWQLYGALDLQHSPWSAHPQTSQDAVKYTTTQKGPFTSTTHTHTKVRSTTWNFNNLFVDWGDGTVVPVSVTQSGDRGQYHADSKVPLGDQHYRHAYSQVGSYTVRVYQLAEGDLQHESASDVSLSVNRQGSLYAAAMSMGGGGHGHDDQTAPRTFKHGKAAGEHAYMMLCKQVVIRARHDPASDGPLNLVAAKVRGFPDQPGNDTPPKGIKVASSASGSSSASPIHATPRSPVSGSHLRADMSAPHATIGGATIKRIDHAGTDNIPKFSACDVSLTGGGYLYYYGQGKARVTWYVDGKSIGSSITYPGPSASRGDHVLASKNPGKPLISAWKVPTSQAIALDKIGRHRLSFDAQVLYDASGLTRLGGLMGRALGTGGGKPDRKLAAQLAAGMHGAPPLGVLPPQGVTLGHGASPVAWLNRPLQRLARRPAKRLMVAALERGRYDTGDPIMLGGLLKSARTLPHNKPPSYVAAPARPYQVLGYKSGQACMFHFPVKGGEFIIGGLQEPGSGKPNVTHHGNHWSGSGKLFIHLAGGTIQWPVPLTFKDWTLKGDQTTVASGSFDIPNPIESGPPMPGANVQFLRLRGKAGDSVQLTLRARIANANILATDNQKPPPALTATAVLTPHGDWYADKLSLPKLDVYDSGFTLAPKSVTLDFSATQGGACNAGGDGWMGFAFGDGSQLNAYTFELKKTQSASVSGWGIDEQGLCGAKSFGTFDSAIDRGSIHWDGIDAHANSGAFTATYKGVRVHVPWLDTDLKGGDQLERAGKGSGGGTLTLNLKGDAPAHDYGAVSMDANGLQFGTFKGVGWAVQAQTTMFGFRADGKTFAKNIAVPDLYFGMNGKAYFQEDGGSTHVNLSGAKGRLSQGVVDLKGLDVTATPNSSSRLLFNFSTELRISDALPAAPAPVSYSIDEASAAKYTSAGPITGSFEIHKPFPDANPSTDSVIHPTYVGGHANQSAEADPLQWLINDAHADSGSHMTYCGDVDLGMFGGPPVKGGFALGYQGSDDFWAARADVSMGKTGTPLVPPFMTLYTIGGGLGYNITITSFLSGSSCDVQAKIDHTPVFNAHVVVGDPTHFTYGFDGKLTVKVSGPEAGARMDYKAWLVRKKWTGAGDFHGRFTYANGNFDGTLNGHYSFLDNKVYIEATHDAISMHFGGGYWYIHAGTKSNPVHGHVLIINAGAWLGLGSKGMYAGAKAKVDLGGGNCDDACAKIHADSLVEANITPQPHISAKANLHVHADACAFGICLGAGVGAKMSMAALPPELAFAFRLGDCPPGHLDIGLRILPSPKPEIGGGVCL